MSTQPKLMRTTDYTLFVAHEYNRPLHVDKSLEESMKKHGFLPSSPIHCVHNKEGKLKVIRGHHRLDYAKRLGLPVYYVIDDTDVHIFELESGRQSWNTKDFCQAYAQAGNKDIQEVLDFANIHNISIPCAAALISGRTGNSAKEIKQGTFCGRDMQHANKVVGITDSLQNMGYRFVISPSFLFAISMVVRVPDFDSGAFIKKVRTFPGLFEKRADKQQYLELIETIYNHQRPMKSRVGIALEAKRIASERNAVSENSKTRAKGSEMTRKERFRPKSE